MAQQDQHHQSETAAHICPTTGLQLVKGAVTGGFHPLDPAPLQQHPAYALTLQALGTRATFYQIKRPDSSLLATLLILERSFFSMLTVMTQLRGPCFMATPTADEERAIYPLIQKLACPWRWRFLIQSPNQANSVEAHKALRRAGLKRVTTGFHTGFVDLTGDEAAIRKRLKGKWRNQLKKAESAGMTVAVTDNPNAASARWIIENELTQREARGYQALPAAFLDAWKLHGKILTVVALKGREKRAGALTLIHGAGATYHLGLSTDAGRAVNAQNLVLYKTLCLLQEKGVKTLDLGGIDDGPLKSISHFKMGTGARPVSLIGSYTR